MSFRAIVAKKGDDKKQTLEVTDLTLDALPKGNVTVKVEASTINYKDGLAMAGKGIIRKFPMVPGIDFSGSVTESTHKDFKAGDKVILNGYGASENLWGGYSGMWRGNGDHLVPLPNEFTASQAMAVGTGGYTAMLSVLALERGGVKPDSGEVLVTGACGGVGTVAVALLSGLGYTVVALTGRTEEHEFLKKLGAARIISRDELMGKKGPLQKEQFAGVVDSVGSAILVNAIAQTKYLGVVTACGLAAGSDLPATVLPFILRGVSLVGIDSVQAPMDRRREAWLRLAKDLNPAKLALITEANEIGLNEVPEAGTRILAGKIRGRVVVNMSKL